MALAEKVRVPQEVQGRWVLDAGHSNVGFAARHMMISTVRGRFDDVAGSFQVDDSTVAGEIRIQAASISTGNADRDGHLRTGDFLEAESYPEIVFVATSFDLLDESRARVRGELTIKDVTRPVELAAEFNGFTPVDVFGNPRLSMTLSGMINRKDYGVNWNKALETGGVLVGDDVRLELEVAAVRGE